MLDVLAMKDQSLAQNKTAAGFPAAALSTRCCWLIRLWSPESSPA